MFFPLPAGKCKIYPKLRTSIQTNQTIPIYSIQPEGSFKVFVSVLDAENTVKQNWTKFKGNPI